MLSAGERARYSRHLLLPEIGSAGQEKLKAARVLVVGAGGLGSPASLYLAAAGVGTLGVIDHDRIELSNLQRQVLFSTASIGTSKAGAARDRLLSLNPEISVPAHDLELRAANAIQIIEQYDLVIDGSDRLTTRYLVNDVCVLLHKPLVSAAIHRFEGQAMTYVPAQGPCYRCLFPRSADGVAANCAEAGVLGVLPGILGALQAAEALKLIVGIGMPLVGRLLTFDALAMSWHEFRFARRADCAVCGDSPSIQNPEQSAAANIDHSASAIKRLEPGQLQALLQGQPGDGAAPALVDVREVHEFTLSHLPGAIHMPLAELPRRLAEIPRDLPLVFICRSGRRSWDAANLALRAGRDSLAHLEGGMLAWAAALDPAMVVAPSA
jgi:molybdopterin/thiamine biosynthesis adenylyltransferase/rhodanese-related sulfurtransferase